MCPVFFCARKPERGGCNGRPAPLYLIGGAYLKRAENVPIQTQEDVHIQEFLDMIAPSTGLSRGFFYKNPEVRSEIDRAMEQQAGTADPRRGILDKAMDGRIELLQQQVAKLKQENEILQKENQKLRKALNKQDKNIIRNL